MRFLIFLALSACPLLAQFSELAATYDGQELYFSSQLSLTGTTPVKSESRIFRIKNGQPQLFAERDLTTTGAVSGGGSSDGARSAQVSNDGLTVGYTLTGDCVVPNTCTATFTTGGNLAIVRGTDTKSLGAGTLSMSKNAQWAVITNQPSPVVRGLVPGASTPVPVPAAESVLINLVTNERITLPEAVAGFIRSAAVVASDGSVLLSGTQGPGVWRAGNFTPLIVPGGIGLQMLSDNGRMIVYSQLPVVPAPSSTTTCSTTVCIIGQLLTVSPRLFVRDSWNGIDMLIATGGTAVMGISNDGQRLLYRTIDSSPSGSAFIANIIGGDILPIPLPDGELATDGTLSGDGNTAFLVTTKGRIVSVDLLHGLAIHTIVAPTFYLSNSSSLFAPGSLAHLTGVLPSTVDEVKGKILLNDVAVPVIYANAAEVAVQIPWEAPVQATLRLDLPSDSPFQQKMQVTLVPSAARFEQPANGQPNVLGFLAVKGDFSGLVTTNPAPGDVIIAYATGLGPVLNHPPTGQPTPVDRLYPIQSTLSCRFSPYTLPVETLFAGLAPGLTGLYQINFRLPPGPNLGAITGGQCSLSGPGFSSSFGWAKLTTPQ